MGIYNSPATKGEMNGGNEQLEKQLKEKTDECKDIQHSLDMARKEIQLKDETIRTLKTTLRNLNSSSKLDQFTSMNNLLIENKNNDDLLDHMDNMLEKHHLTLKRESRSNQSNAQQPQEVEIDESRIYEIMDSYFNENDVVNNKGNIDEKEIYKILDSYFNDKRNLGRNISYNMKSDVSPRSENLTENYTSDRDIDYRATTQEAIIQKG
eukprot:UN29558